MWALGFAVFTVLGLCDAAEEYVQSRYENHPLSWLSALALGLGLWYTWAVLGLLVFILARRFPLGQKDWRRRLALHLAASVAVASVKIVLDYPFINYLYCPTHSLSFGAFLGMAFSTQLTSYLLVYWGMILISHAIGYYAKFRERELHASQLETGLARRGYSCSRASCSRTSSSIRSTPSPPSSTPTWKRPIAWWPGWATCCGWRWRISGCRRRRWPASWK